MGPASSNASSSALLTLRLNQGFENPIKFHQMISAKSKYALKAMFVLSQEYGHGPILISEIAAREKIPRRFLEIILLELKTMGVLRSKKGKGGGYQLSKPPAEITVGHVLRILEGPLAPLPCVSKTAYERCAECIDESVCAIRIVMKDVRDATARILDSTTFADLLKRSQIAVRGAGAIEFSI